MDLKPIEKLRPFQKFCITIGELPVSYLESMTYLELLYWFINFLQEKVIPAVNTNAAAVEELQTLFTQLHDYVENYFDNLDVQEEIDHKLDEMVEDGTLTNLLLNYTNVARIYTTTAEMILDTSNISVGQKIKTLGYYELNDNGGANFIVVENAIENEYCIELGTNKYALLIVENTIKPEQVGVQNNTETNLMTLVSNIANKHKIPIELSNKTYLITESMPLFSGCEIFGKGTIKSNLDIPVLYSSTAVSGLNIHDITISASTDEDHTNADGISVPCFYSKFNNITIQGGYRAIVITTNASGTLVENQFSNIICRGPRYAGLYLGSTDNNKITDGFLNNIIVNGSTNCAYGIYIGSSAGWILNGCHFYGNIRIPIVLLNAFHTNVSNIYIEKALGYSIFCGRVQTSLNINNVTINQTNDENPCINIERSTYHPTNNSDINISNITIARPETYTSNIITCVSLNARVSNINLNANNQNPRNYCTGCIFNVTGVTKDNFINIIDNKTTIGKSLITKKATISDTTQLEIPVPQLADYTISLLRLKCFGGVYYDGIGKYYSAELYFTHKNSTPVIKKFNEVNSMFSDISYSLDIENKKIVISYTFNAEHINAVAEYEVDA